LIINEDVGSSASHSFPKLRKTCAPAYRQAGFCAGEKYGNLAECLSNNKIKSPYMPFCLIFCNIKTSYNQDGNGAKRKSMVVRIV
jgi:hypothetical protein